MNKQVEKGKTLLIDGPASVTVVSGKAVVFGLPISDNRGILIREGKRLPFTVEENASFSLSLGNAGGAEEVAGSTIPPSWHEAFENLQKLPKKPAVAMVIGGVDSGKTSFCTFLINKLITEKHSVAVLDEDMGQSDIGPPCTIAYAHVSKLVTDLFTLKGENTFFVGATSPSEAADATIEGTAVLMAEILSKKAVDFVVVNTDGWAEGEEAVKFKAQLAKAINPDVVFCLEPNNVVPSLCATFGDALEEFNQERAESPVTVRLRNKEKRKILRELGYAKYLTGAKVRSLSLKRLKIRECCQKSPENQSAKPTGTETPKKKIALRLGELRGLLVGLLDEGNRFLGIGTLQSVDYTRQMLQVRTTVPTHPSVVLLGKLRLDENFHELSTSPTDI